jgi:hypothetical protein
MSGRSEVNAINKKKKLGLVRGSYGARLSCWRCAYMCPHTTIHVFLCRIYEHAVKFEALLGLFQALFKVLLRLY